jgi:hypothetical protein
VRCVEENGVEAERRVVVDQRRVRGGINRRSLETMGS